MDESAVKQAARSEGVATDEAALLLARLKADRVARTRPDAVVIGADQILVCDGEWFDKPADMAEPVRICAACVAEATCWSRRWCASAARRRYGSMSPRHG